MEGFNNCDIMLSKQERCLLSKSPKLTVDAPKPYVSLNLSNTIRDCKKNLDFLFGQCFDPKTISHFCSLLKQWLPIRIGPEASTNAILATLKDIFDEGQLPEDKTMEEVNSDCQHIDNVESACLITSMLGNVFHSGINLHPQHSPITYSISLTLLVNHLTNTTHPCWRNGQKNIMVASWNVDGRIGKSQKFFVRH